MKKGSRLWGEGISPPTTQISEQRTPPSQSRRLDRSGICTLLKCELLSLHHHGSTLMDNHRSYTLRLIHNSSTYLETWLTAAYRHCSDGEPHKIHRHYHKLP